VLLKRLSVEKEKRNPTSSSGPRWSDAFEKARQAAPWSLSRSDINRHRLANRFTNLALRSTNLVRTYAFEESNVFCEDVLLDPHALDKREHEKTSSPASAGNAGPLPAHVIVVK
jgi:hypothetical protein